MKNLFPNFNPQERIVCNEKNPPWIITKIKDLIQKKNTAYKYYQKGNKKI